jgi:hypothetical protein
VEGDPLSLPFLPVISEGGLLLPLLLSLLLPVILERSEDPASAFGFAGLIQRREGRFLWVAARAMYKGSEVLKHSVVLMNLDHWGNRLAL